MPSHYGWNASWLNFTLPYWRRNSQEGPRTLLYGPLVFFCFFFSVMSETHYLHRRLAKFRSAVFFKSLHRFPPARHPENSPDFQIHYSKAQEEMENPASRLPAHGAPPAAVLVLRCCKNQPYCSAESHRVSRCSGLHAGIKLLGTNQFVETHSS